MSACLRKPSLLHRLMQPEAWIPHLLAFYFFMRFKRRRFLTLCFFIFSLRHVLVVMPAVCCTGL